MGVSASVTLQWDRGRCLAGNQRLRSDRSQHRGRGGWLTHLHLETLAIGLRAVRDSDRRRETTCEARVGSHHKARRRARCKLETYRSRLRLGVVQQRRVGSRRPSRGWQSTGPVAETVEQTAQATRAFQ